MSDESAEENAFSSEEWLVVKHPVSQQNLKKLMLRVSTNHYTASNHTDEDTDINIECNRIIRKDSNCLNLDNLNGSLSLNYPRYFVLPFGDKKAVDPGERYTNYKNLVEEGNGARFMCRFPVPVMIWNNKLVCRSGTLAARTSAVYETSKKPSEPKGGETSVLGGLVGKTTSGISSTVKVVRLVTGGMEEFKDTDVKILKHLGIFDVCDFMVQNRRKYTFSSEKANPQKYKDFDRIQMPYPEIDIFKPYSKERKSSELKELTEKLVINWDQIEQNIKQEPVEFETKDDSLLDDYVIDDLEYLNMAYFKFFNLEALRINWKLYKDWDLITLTKNYLRLLLHILKQANDGVLLHSISGWDRTPLFISLMRISLWADGEIHQTVEPKEMAYLILGYDWYLFGHNLKERYEKNEEIMHFCFNILAEITSSEYSISETKADKKDKIMEVRKILLDLYEETLKPDSRNSAIERK